MCLSVFLPKCFRKAKLQRTEQIQTQTFHASNVLIVLLWPLLPGEKSLTFTLNCTHPAQPSWFTACTTLVIPGMRCQVTAEFAHNLSAFPTAHLHEHEGEVTSQAAWKGHCDWWKGQYRIHTRIPNLRLKHFVLQKQFYILCPEGKFTRILPGFWNHKGQALWNKGRGLPLSC